MNPDELFTNEIRIRPAEIQEGKNSNEEKKGR
jgi:hypothetical protein